MSLNSKHLSTGSPFPPLKDGVLRIYSMRFCPYAQRALLAAIAKNAPFEVVNCNLRQKPEWLFEKNPVAKVPTIEIPGKTQALYESLVICDYLDEAYPGRALRSSDPFVRALDRILLENFNTIISLYYKCQFSPPVDLEEQLFHFQTLFQPFEDELCRRGKHFYGGLDAPGMVDYMIWPWMERFPVLSKSYPTLFPFDKFLSRYPELAKWIDRMKADPAVAATFLGENILHEYAKSSIAGTPNYCLLD